MWELYPKTTSLVTVAQQQPDSSSWINKVHPFYKSTSKILITSNLIHCRMPGERSIESCGLDKALLVGSVAANNYAILAFDQSHANKPQWTTLMAFW